MRRVLSALPAALALTRPRALLPHLSMSSEDASADLVVQKKELRKRMRAEMKALSADEIAEQSMQVCERVKGLEAVQAAAGVCVFLSMPKELQTQGLLDYVFEDNYATGWDEMRAGRRGVFVPKVFGPGRSDMVMLPIFGGQAEIDGYPRSKWDIPEPEIPAGATVDELWGMAAPSMEVVIVPGCAFDAGCNRCGHGKGYYDTFLERLTRERAALGLPPPKTFGVGLQPQVVDGIPMDAHDRPLDMLLTPSAVFES